MSVLSAVAIAEIKARGSIDNLDVLKLRRDYDDGRITVDEAEIIFSLNNACPVQDPAWADWFVETLTDYIVDQAGPEGYLTSDERNLADRSHFPGRPDRDQDGNGSRSQRARSGALVADAVWCVSRSSK